MRGSSSSAATKCISLVPGLVKQTSMPASARVFIRAWAPFMRGTRIVRVENALEQQPSLPQAAQPVDVLPGDARVELRLDPGLERIKVAPVRHLRLEVAEGERLAVERHVQHPAWMREHLPQSSQRRAGAIGGQAVAHVAPARTG
jgi:hypothetical protein